MKVLLQAGCPAAVKARRGGDVAWTSGSKGLQSIFFHLMFKNTPLSSFFCSDLWLSRPSRVWLCQLASPPFHNTVKLVADYLLYPIQLQISSVLQASAHAVAADSQLGGA